MTEVGHEQEDMRQEDNQQVGNRLKGSQVEGNLEGHLLGSLVAFSSQEASEVVLLGSLEQPRNLLAEEGTDQAWDMPEAEDKPRDKLMGMPVEDMPAVEDMLTAEDKLAVEDIP